MFPPAPTFLVDNPEVALAHLRVAVSAVASAEEEQSQALATLREAVVAARVMKVPWAVIADEIGVTRQAAAERFGGDVRSNLFAAWFRVDYLLGQIGDQRSYPGSTMELLASLGDEGAIPPALLPDAAALHDARTRAVHFPSTEISIHEVEDLTEVAVPLAGLLWMTQQQGSSSDEPA